MVETSRNHCGPAEAKGSILERRQVDSRMTRWVVTCRKQEGCRDLGSHTAAGTRDPRDTHSRVCRGPRTHPLEGRGLAG